MGRSRRQLLAAAVLATSDSCGAWWGTPGQVRVCTHGGQDFTLSRGVLFSN